MINPIYDEELAEDVKTHLIGLLGEPDEDWLTKASILKLFLRHGLNIDLQPSFIETLRETREKVISDRKVKRYENSQDFNIITLEEYLA